MSDSYCTARRVGETEREILPSSSIYITIHVIFIVSEYEGGAMYTNYTLCFIHYIYIKRLKLNSFA
jgi:hypothetical protein